MRNIGSEAGQGGLDSIIIFPHSGSLVAQCEPTVISLAASLVTMNRVTPSPMYGDSIPEVEKMKS